MLFGCNDGPKPPPAGKTEAKASPEAKAAPTTESMAERYLAAKERMAALLPEDKDGPTRLVAELAPELREIAEKATDVPLRANASLLLGTLYERAGDRRSAVSFYRQAQKLLPAEIEARRVLALALAADGQYAEAIPEQEAVVKDDPDDLEAWLLLGEINIKAGRADEGAKAYAAYETRRRGLIDGLTLQNKDGTYLMPVDQRAGCARALIPARDEGTALALLYALERDPDPVVRQAIAEAMGTQRLANYKQALTAKSGVETHPEAKAAMLWALQEIDREPVAAHPGPVVKGDPKGEPPPVAADDKAEGAGAAGQGAKGTSEGTGAAGQGEKGTSAGTGAAGAERAAGTSDRGAAPAPAR